MPSPDGDSPVASQRIRIEPGRAGVDQNRNQLVPDLSMSRHFRIWVPGADGVVGQRGARKSFKFFEPSKQGDPLL